MKNKRQEAILDIIREREIKTQEDLLIILRERGFQVTQATVSRDIRELRLVKSSAEGGYKSFPAVSQDNPVPNFRSVFSESIIKIDCAQNLIVVKTYSGMAQAVATCIDATLSSDIIGCVAGDDAILVVVRDNEKTVQLCETMRKMITEK